MLQIPFIRENKELTLAGLHKKHVANAEATVDQILDLDQQRRDTQKTLDDGLARQNVIAKDIGQLMRTGQKEAAEVAKTETANLKAQSKMLGDQLTDLEQQVQTLLV